MNRSYVISGIAIAAMSMSQRDTSTRKITNLLNIVKTSIKSKKDGFAPGLSQLNHNLFLL